MGCGTCACLSQAWGGARPAASKAHVAVHSRAAQPCTAQLLTRCCCRARAQAPHHLVRAGAEGPAGAAGRWFVAGLATRQCAPRCITSLLQSQPRMVPTALCIGPVVCVPSHGHTLMGTSSHTNAARSHANPRTHARFLHRQAFKRNAPKGLVVGTLEPLEASVLADAADSTHIAPHTFNEVRRAGGGGSSVVGGGECCVPSARACACTGHACAWWQLRGARQPGACTVCAPAPAPLRRCSACCAPSMTRQWPRPTGTARSTPGPSEYNHMTGAAASLAARPCTAPALQCCMCARTHAGRVFFIPRP